MMKKLYNMLLSRFAKKSIKESEISLITAEKDQLWFHCGTFAKLVYDHLCGDKNMSKQELKEMAEDIINLYKNSFLYLPNSFYPKYSISYINF